MTVARATSRPPCICDRDARALTPATPAIDRCAAPGPQRLRVSLRLPKLNLVTVGVDNPAEFAEVRGLCVVDDVATFSAQHGEKCIQVCYAEVDHEGRRARLHLVCVRGKRTPNRHSRRALRPAPLKYGSAPFGNVQAKMLAIPSAKTFWIL